MTLNCDVIVSEALLGRHLGPLVHTALMQVACDIHRNGLNVGQLATLQICGTQLVANGVSYGKLNEWTGIIIS